MTRGSGRAPQRLAQAVSELIAMRGWAQVQGHGQLVEAWRSIAGAKLAPATRVIGIRRGVLQVAVGNAPLLSELVAFHKSSLLEALRTQFPQLKVRDLKFVLKGDLSAA